MTLAAGEYARRTEDIEQDRPTSPRSADLAEVGRPITEQYWRISMTQDELPIDVPLEIA